MRKDAESMPSTHDNHSAYPRTTDTIAHPTMTSLHGDNVAKTDKPVEVAHKDSLPSHLKDPGIILRTLDGLVENSIKYEDVQHTIHAPMHKLGQLPFVQKLLPGIETYASQYHIGNYVAMRGSTERFFESMPLYPR